LGGGKIAGTKKRSTGKVTSQEKLRGGMAQKHKGDMEEFNRKERESLKRTERRGETPRRREKKREDEKGPRPRTGRTQLP